MIASVAKHPYIYAGSACFLVWIVTGGSIRLLADYGIPSGLAFGIYLASLAALAAVFAVYLVRKKLTDTVTTAVIMTGGALVRLWYVLMALPNGSFQHDFGYFDYNLEYAVHENYFFYLIYNHALPDFDFRGTGQYYHPPLHYVISAIAVKINSAFFPSRADNYEFLMCISLFYSLAVLILIYKLLKLFEIKGRALHFALLLAAFYPSMIISAVQINNDPLASLLFIAGFYFAVRWYKERKTSQIIITAVCIGCAMMTKISAGLIAVPVGFIFLAALIRSGFKGKKIWSQFGIFALTVFPLGLWFPVRNYIKWGIPPTYVFDLGIVPDQDLSGYSVLQRLFGISEVSLSIPFTVFGEEYKDFNIFMILYKTSLFDDHDLHDRMVPLALATFMFLIGALLMIMLIAGLVKMIMKCRGSIEKISVILLLVTEFVSSIIFAFKYPLICSVNFRYIFPVVIAGALSMGMFFEGKDIGSKISLKHIAGGILGCFCLVSVIYYSIAFLP